MPDHSLARRGIEQQVIRMTIAVKIRNGHNLPAAGKRWPRRSADDKVVVEVPNCRLTRAWVVKKENRVWRRR